MSLPTLEAPAENSLDSDIYVVGVGASAGGLEALEQMFLHMPPDSGMAFVVIQHLSPDFKSQMDELLQRWTTLQVCVVEHEQRLIPNTVALMPPNAEFVVSKGRLLLKQRRKGLPAPIDRFLCSLAHDAGDHAIAVVLSGTGSDGSRGVREIHDAGGLVIVQSKETAKFDGMPKSALQTGVVDLMLPPADIGAALLRHLRHLTGEEPAHDDASEAVKEGGMRAVLALLNERCGIDFSAYKPGTIERRTERRLMLNQSSDLGEYVERLRTDRDELDALYRDLLIGVTQFFRDVEAFDKLERDVLPQLVSNIPPGRELRVWVAGCATGEEAYSLAILVAEAIERAKHSIPAKIFATDVHQSSLDHASAGVYSASALEAVTPARRERFFVREQQGFRVSAELRRMIVFAPHNVIQDAPFTKLDLVSCRNLLIYLQPAVQRKVLSLFHFGLRVGGVMFLGPSETASDIGEVFEVIDSQARLYRKLRDMRLVPGPRTNPLAQLSSAALSHGPQGAGTDVLLLEVFGTLLDQALPPSVLLDYRRQIVHSFGDVSSLLRLPRGRPSLSLLDMLEGELKLAVAGALHRAARTREVVYFTGVRARTGGEEHLNLRVTPMATPRLPEPFFLVSLESSAEPGPPPPPSPPVDLPALSHDRLEALELELRHTKENLQATIEELEASNEELQSTNEELLASNEELQSTNEELNSVNEELYKVNTEFQHKIDQLTEITDDMDNLLLSTEVHTLFLDEHLCIRKFTPAIGETFHLVDGDVGRRIDGFVHTIAFEGLGKELQHTLQTGERFEQEVESRSGTTFLMRIVPYYGRRSRAGVVLTLIDVTRLREVELALREQVLARDRFLAVLSHELRNPLAAINNALALLDHRLAAAADDQASLTREVLDRPLQVIHRQTRHMRHLLDDLLDVSRVTQGKIRLHEDLVDLGTLARELVEQVQPVMDQHRHAFAVAIDAEPLWIRGDRTRILQIVDNLLTNAIKYTPEGGHVTLRVGSADGRAQVEVGDDGAGIDEQTRQHIFEIFVQADTTLDRNQGGLGVGLTLVHQLVEMHKGEIEVHSEGRDQGARFVVWLPLAQPREQAQTSTASPTESHRHGSAKLVVVEDHEEIRETLAELLRDDGFQVLTANDGAEGLQLIERERPIAALLDIGLPGLDGYEIARQVRGTPALAKTLLVAITGYGTDEDKLKVVGAGFDAHIVKPFYIENVLGALEKLGVQG